MESQSQLTNTKEIIEYLVVRFPNCFTLDGETKPLKIGILQDLAIKLNDDNVVSKTKLRAALKSYTMHWRYLKCIKEGAYRIDLDGTPSEVVTKENIDHVQLQLKERKARAKENIKNKHKNAAQTEPELKSKPKAKQVKTLVVGDFVKVALSQKPISVQIIQIEKDNIKVRSPSGMELTVKSESIITD